MTVTCPNCSTKYNLPADKVSDSTQLRCTVCKEVFTLAEAQGQAPKGPVSLNLDDLPPKASGKGRGLKIAVNLLFLLLFGAASVFAYAWFAKPELISSYVPFMQKNTSKAPQEDLISLITLRGVRQYSIENEKLGTISVIEGRAVNGFDKPRELIRLEASLYDKDGNVLVSKQQLGGTQVSLFQLQVLGEQELEQALGNKIDILSNNTNVPPKGEVPFMIVFYKPAENATEFGVKVVEAKIPPPAK